MKHKGFLIRAAISLVLLALLFAITDLRALFRTFQGTHLGYCAVVLALALLDRVFMAFKWNILVRAIDIHISFWESVRTYLASSFVGLFLPTSVGSDVLRLFIVGVERNQRDGIAASIVVERLVGFIALLFLFVVMASAALFYFSFHKIGLVVAVAAVLLVVSMGILAFSLYRLPSRLLNRVPGRLGELLTRLLFSYQRYGNRKQAMLVFFGLSFLEHFLPILCNFFVAMALGIKVDAFAFFVIIPIILVFARLPISLDGIGIQEGLYWVLFQMAGLSRSEALSLALLARFLTTLALLPGGLLFMFHPGRRAMTKEGAR